MGVNQSVNTFQMSEKVRHLHIAVIRNDVEAVKRLVCCQIDVDSPWCASHRPSPKDGITPLFEAITLHHRKVTEVLIDAGASVNRADLRGLTALHQAASFGDQGLADLLIKAGANVQSLDRNLNTALHVCVKHARLQNKIGTVRLLIESGCNVNAANDTGKIALHYSVMWGLQDITRILIKANAVIDYVDANLETPLCSCIRHISAMSAHESCGSTGMKEMRMFLQRLPAIRALLAAGCDSLNLASWLRENCIFAACLPVDEDFRDFYISNQPECLKHLCRVAIQKNFTYITDMGLPRSLVDYLRRRLI